MPVSQVAALLDGIPHAVVLINAQGIVKAINHLGYELFSKGLEGRHHVTVLRQPILLECVENCFQSQSEVRAQFSKSTASHDTVFQVVCRPVLLEDGKGVLMSFQDVTPFEAAGQMRRDFVANVSHELRTPLTALAGFIETLRGPAKDDSKARERFLGIMEKETSRMNRLVRDLLSLSRVESEERIRPEVEVDITAVLEAAIVSLRPMAEESDVTLVFEPPKEPLLIPGDSDQLQQVFSNLLENGIKYGARNEDVTIKLVKIEYEPRLQGPALSISVADKGEGIDPHHIPRLTERFYRVDGHRSREMGGTGLGLAIVKHIVNRHRGYLKIDSNHGKGSVFTAVLPLS